MRKLTVCIQLRPEVHERRRDHLPILNGLHETPPPEFLPKPGIALIGQQLLLQAPPLLRREPRRILRKIRKAEEQDGREGAREDALEDEDPAPGGIAAHAFHLADGAGEDGEPLLDLGPGVPHADQVITCVGCGRQQMDVLGAVNAYSQG